MNNSFNLIKNKKIKKLLFVFSLFFFFNSFSVNAYDFSQNSGLNEAAEKTGHSGSKIFSGSDAGTSIETSVGEIIQAVISLIGVLFLVLLVYGGFLWMTARGNDQQVEKAKKIMTESIIGVFIVVSAYAISIFVISVFNSQ